MKNISHKRAYVETEMAIYMAKMEKRGVTPPQWVVEWTRDLIESKYKENDVPQEHTHLQAWSLSDDR